MIASGLILINLVVILLMVSAFRPVSRKDVAWFAFQHHFSLTPDNGGMVIDYLARTRRWRTYGALGALAGGGTYHALVFDNSGALPILPVLFGGWFAGGILAEYPVGRSRRKGSRSALLIERRLTSYVSLLAKRLFAIAVLVGGVALALSATVSNQRWSNSLLLIAVACAVALVATVGIHRVVRRPQSAAAADVLAAETAVRTAAVTRIGAGWIVLQFIIDIGLLAQVWDGADAAQWVASPLTFVCLAGVLLGWAFVPTRVADERPVTAALTAR